MRSSEKKFRLLAYIGALVLPLVLLAGCGEVQPVAQPVSAKGVVQVLYAGSLAGINEGKVGPAFTKVTGYPYQGQGMGAFGAAQLIKSGTVHPDVFLSMGDAPIKLLSDAGMIPWAVPFARDQLVVAYNPKGPFGSELAAAAAGTKPWYMVLESKGFRLGRTNPDTDPQGQAFLFMLGLAAKHYGQPNLKAGVLANSRIFQETAILSRLQAGQLDAASAFRSEAIQRGLPYIALPSAINLGDPAEAIGYATQSYKLPNGSIVTGKPLALYATVLKKASNPVGGMAFVHFLLSQKGQGLYQRAGYGSPAGLASEGTVPSAVTP